MELPWPSIVHDATHKTQITIETINELGMIYDTIR